MQRVHRSLIGNGVIGRPQRLRHDLPAIKSALPIFRMKGAKQMLFDAFQLEKLQKFFEGRAHGLALDPYQVVAAASNAKLDEAGPPAPGYQKKGEAQP